MVVCTTELTPSKEFADALTVTLGLSEDRMRIWALNGDPFEESDETTKGGHEKERTACLCEQFKRMPL